MDYGVCVLTENRDGDALLCFCSFHSSVSYYLLFFQWKFRIISSNLSEILLYFFFLCVKFLCRWHFTFVLLFDSYSFVDLLLSDSLIN